LTIPGDPGTGIWRYYDPREQARDLARVHFGGGLPARGTFAFDAWIRASGARDGRDIQIGSVGGGNHFVELQAVEEILDGPAAHAFGLPRGAVTIMAHSGSVGLGHMVGGWFEGRAHALYPRGVPHPGHGFHVLPTRGPHAAEAARYLDAMRNAANFAFANRLFLGLMVVRALSEALHRTVSARLVYEVSGRRGEREVLVFVRDEGPGIRPENLPHVFDRYWQAERKDGKLGLGLGLAIVKGIVEAHGGCVWASSPPGEGATFAFSLPLAAPA